MPSATVSRVLSKATENPSFDTVSSIVMSLGGSLDEMLGVPRETQKVPDPLIAEKDERIGELKERVSLLKSELKNARRMQAAFAVIAIVLLTTAVVFLMMDLFNGHFGYFRY